MKKQLYLLVTALIVSAAFVACDKENGGNNGNGNNSGNNNGNNDINTLVINATNVICLNPEYEDDSNVATVKAFARGFEVVSSPYQNKGFTLNLSKTVPEQYLQYILIHFWDYYYYDIPAHFVSDRNSKCGILDISAFDNSDKVNGLFTLRERKQVEDEYYEYFRDYIRAYYIYADRDFTIKGFDNPNQYDCSFKKGWNIVYLLWHNDYSHYPDIMTTTKPANSNLKWYYSENYYE